MSFDDYVWLHIALAAFPQLIVIIGWLVYISLCQSKQVASQQNMSTDLKGVDIAIPVRNFEPTLPNLISDIQDARSKGARVVLLDSSHNCPIPTSGSRSHPISLVSESEWSMCETEWGIHCWGHPPFGYKAGVLNLWFQNSDSDIVVVIDADWRVDTNDILHLVNALRSKSHAAFAQGRWDFLNSDESWIAEADSSSLYLHHQVEQKLRAKCGIPINMNGSLTAVRREIVVQYGGFDGTQLSEDVDLAFRFARLGYAGVYDSSATGRGRVAKNIDEYRNQKVRWAAGRLQALWRYGLPFLLQGSLYTRLLTLHYLLEYGTAPSAILLSVISTYPNYPMILRLFAIGFILVPGLLRAFLTARQSREKARPHKAVLIALGDLILRSLLSSTCLVLFGGTLLGWTPGWRWENARYRMIGISLLFLALPAYLLPRITDFIGFIGWILLVSILGSGLVLWGWPSPNTSGSLDMLIAIS